MNVLAVVGSPRKGGNTDILVDEVIRGAKDSGANVEKHFLSDLTISPCLAECSEYCEKNGNCRINDDMTPLYSKLFKSDAIILGTPIYWWGPSAQFKMFLDRWYAFSHPEFANKLQGKIIVLIAPFGDSDTSVADPLVNMISRSLDFLKAHLFKTILVSVEKKGEIKSNTQVMNNAYDIGREIVST
jgi:multimeric flavodoxin WrbA